MNESLKGAKPMKLKGKAAIVTGGGRGIGRAIALELARQGAAVVVNDPGSGRSGETTTERPADEVAAEIVKAGGRAVANHQSVADHAQARQMVQQCIDSFGSIDILVNSAGVLRERMIWNMTEDDFDAVIGVHLKGSWNMSHHAIRHMRTRGFGRIINLSSDAFKGSLGQCNYAAAKAGIIGLTRSIAKEAAKFGITANALCPLADTRMTLTPEVAANRKRRLENGLITQAQYDNATQPKGPEYVAPLAAYLSLDEANYINGQVFHVEKGAINTYFYGEDRNSMFKIDDGGLFTVEELQASLQRALLNNIPPIVPVVQPDQVQRVHKVAE
jgi:3-oxoacyl-[acyl-carrier protein] reductase